MEFTEKPLERKKSYNGTRPTAQNDAKAPCSYAIIIHKPRIDENVISKLRALGKMLSDPDKFIVEHYLPKAEWIRPLPWRTRPSPDNFCSLIHDVQHKDQNFTSLVTKCPYDIVAIYDPENDYPTWKPPISANPNAVTYCIFPAQKPRLNEKRDFFLGHYKETVDLQQGEEDRLIICTHLRGPSNISADLPEDDMREIPINDNAPQEAPSTPENEKGLWARICIVQ